MKRQNNKRDKPRSLDTEIIDDVELLQALKSAIQYEANSKPKICWMCGQACPITDIPDKWTCDKGHAVEQLGWEWMDVATTYTTISHMVRLGMARVKYKSNKHTHYLLTDRQRASDLISNSEKHKAGGLIPKQPSATELPDDLFGSIVGHEDVKKLMKKVITADEPIHVLLIGPPASAKTMFQIEIEKLPGAFFIDGANVTKAGLTDMMFNQEIRYLEIDEMEEMSDNDVAGLISFMQTGRLSETKYGRTRTKTMKTWVIGSCNNTKGFSSKLLSRFLTIEFSEYSYDQFLEIVIRVLQRSRPTMTQGTIEKIGEAVWSELRSRDIRDVIKIAALVSDNEKDLGWIIKTLSHHKT